MSARRLLGLAFAALSFTVVGVLLPSNAHAQGCPQLPVRGPGPSDEAPATGGFTCDTVVITPSAGTLPDQSAFTQGHSATFWVKNVGPQSDTFTFQCVPNAPYTICSSLSITSHSLAAGDSVQVTVYFATDHPVTGTQIQLYANGQTYGGAAQGYYSFNITAPNYAVIVMPSSKTTVPRWAFAGPYSDTLKVRNIGALVDTFNLSCTPGAGTTCATTSPTKVTLQSGDSATVTANYSVGWPGTGNLTFTATSVFGSGPPTASAVLTVPIYVGAPNVSTAPYNYDDQDLARCASGCFAARTSQGTVPYVTLGTPRRMALVYQGERIIPRPFIAVDAQLTNTPNHPKQFWLQAKVDGVFLPFLNGDTTMHFAYDAASIRLAGQIDAKSYATGVHALQIIVTAQYDSAGVTAVTVVNTSLVVVNEAASPVGRGWTVAGVQRLYPQADSSAIVTTGDGSYVYFHHSCDRWGCNSPTETPAGEFSRLVRGTPSGGLGWTRQFADSSKVVFDNTGRMTQMLDRFGNTANVVYDANGRIWKIQDPTYTTGNNHQVVLAYAAGYGLSTITDPMGRVTRVTVNADSTLRVIKFFNGDSVQFAYTADATKRLQAITDPRGYSVSFFYNTLSGKIDSVALPTISINGGAPQSPVTRYAPWQTKGEPTSGTGVSPFTPVRTDSVRAAVTDPEGHATSYTVDHWGQPLVTTDAAGRKVTVGRDVNGLPLSITNPWGGVDSASYNPDGLVTGYTPSGQSATSITIGAYGQPQEISGTNQTDQYFFLGQSGRVDSIRYAGQDSIKIRFTYNTRGQVLTAKDPKGHTSSYHYDATFGNMDSIAVPGVNGPSTIRYTRKRFDKFGRDSATSSTGMPWSRTVYDSMNRPLQLYDGVYATPTTLSYDHGILTRVIDVRGQVFKDSMNALGWPTRTYGSADTTKFVSLRYNRDGLIVGSTNRRSQTLTYAYDAVHRPLAQYGQNSVPDSFAYKDSAGGPVTIAWDSVARDSSFANPSLVHTRDVTNFGARRFERDYYANSVGTLDSVVVKTDTGTHIPFVRRSFHRNAFTQTVDYVMIGNAQIDFFVDAAGRLLTTTFWNTTPQVSKFQKYTSMGMLDSLGVDKPTLNTSFGHAYAYDSTARIASESNSDCSKAREFSYDGRSRLTKTTYVHYNRFGWFPLDLEWGGSCSGTRVVDSTLLFTYDSLNNRTDNSATYNAGNRLSSMAGFSFTYDDDGNELTRVGNGQNVNYYWTADGLLDSVNAGTTRIAYQYDAQGRLVRKDRNGRPYRYFLWEGGALMAELDSTARKRVAEYVYNAGLDNPITLIPGDSGVTRYFSLNGLGDVVGVVRDTFVDQYILYDAWGTQQQVTGTVADTNRLRFKGMFWEGDSTRLYYARTRWYDPTTGRFTSEDRVGLGGGLNVYTFAGGDPVNIADPTGTDEVDPRCKYGPAAPPPSSPNDPAIPIPGVSVECPRNSDPPWEHHYEGDEARAIMDQLLEQARNSFYIIEPLSIGGGASSSVLCTEGTAAPGMSITVRKDASGDAETFINDLVNKGYAPTVGSLSSFRTWDQQEEVFLEAFTFQTTGVLGPNGVRLAAFPGTGNHQGGDGIDIGNIPNKYLADVVAIAAKNNYYQLTGPSGVTDPWHFEHAGASPAHISDAIGLSGKQGACR